MESTEIEVTLYPAWKQAVKAVMEGPHDPGTLLSSSWLQEQFDLATPVTAEDQKIFQINWLKAFNSFKDALLFDHKICLKTCHNGYYEIVAPQKQTDVAVTVHMRKMRREMKQMVNKLVHIDHSALTAEERQHNANALAKAATLGSSMRERRKIGIFKK